MHYELGTVCAHRSPRYLLIYHAFKLHIYVKVKTSHSSAQRVMLIVAKKLALSEIQRYVSDSLLKHQLMGKVFQQIVGIPIRTNCAPLLADTFLYSYEAEFIQSLLSTGRKQYASRLNFT